MPVGGVWFGRGNGVVKKVLTWGLLAFLVFYLVTQPNDSAQIIKSLGGGVKNIAVGLGDFVSGLN
jgi:hypothetical protein